MASLKNRFEKIGEGSAEALDLFGGNQPILANLPIEQIEPDPDQPRKDVGDITDLKASIKEHGIVQPVIVSILAVDHYRLIAGERRFTAAKALKLQTVPAIVRTIEEHRRLEVQLIENIHRKELNPLEEASAYQRLLEEFKLSQRQLAQRLGKSPASINQTLRILSLPRQIVESVQTSEHITRSVLLEIAKLESEADQLAFWKRALAGNLTVKTAREGKKPDTTEKPPVFKFPRIDVPGASISVTVEGQSASVEEVREFLREALRVLGDSSAVDMAPEPPGARVTANGDGRASPPSRKGAL